MNRQRRILSAALILLVALRAEGQEVQNAVSFLSTSQDPDGGWRPASCGDIFETTALAARALAEAGSAGAAAVDRAFDFLAARDPVTPREAALRALALHAAGRDNAADLARIQSMYVQRWFPSGWGVDAASEPEILTTALAIEALATSPSPPDVRAPLGFLIAAYFTDERFFPPTYPTFDQGSLFASARCLAAMNASRSRYYLIEFISTRVGGGVVGAARALQDASGGWGDRGPTVLETAMVLHMVKTSRVPLLESETRAADYLKSLQLANGSWENDPFATAWVLRALALAIDTDADGAPDEWEAAHGLDPRNFFDGATDGDGDGLTNLAEYQARSDPRRADTDGDGVSDADEVANYSDPASAASKNRAPSFTSSPSTIAAAGATYRYAAEASDPDGDPVTFRLAGGPTGLSVTEANGRVSWSIAASTSGRFQVAIESVDSKGAKGFQAYTLTVVPGGVDLVSGKIDLAGFRADTQTLIASGTVRVEVRNDGTEPFTGSFEIALFVDKDGSGGFEPAADVPAGSAAFSGSIPSLGSASLDVPAAAAVAFRDAPLHAFIDSSRRIPESDETNNVGSSGSASRHVGSLKESLPIVEWTWPGVGGGDVYSWTSPVVAPLVDTTGDGVVDGRDVPAVVFVAGVPNVSLQVRAHRGDTGETLWVFTDPALNGGSLKGPVIADLDADGVPEVLSHGHFSATLVAINADGSLKWKKPNDSWGSPLVVADLDADGFPEILSPGVTYDHQGDQLWTATTLSGSNGVAPLPVDLDLDGDLEVVYENAAVDHAGTALWRWVWNGAVESLIADGQVLETRAPLPYVNFFNKNAVIQADDDPEPEIVAINDSSFLVNAHPLWCFEPDGRIKWGPVPVAFAEPERGYTPLVSLPVVADFDGDGAPEVVVVISTASQPSVSPPEPGKTAVLCFDADGSALWRWESKTGAINANGSSLPTAYDFDGDGSFEVLVNTAHELVILSGKDGSPVWRIGAEYGIELNGPVVADVDNDGGAEIVRTLWPSYYFGSELRSGIVVIGDANDEWSNARRIWSGVRNDGINLSEAGRVSASFAPGWFESGSTPRQLGLDGHTPHDAPDLTVSRLRADTSACPDVVLIARVGNGGSIHAPAGTPVEFWQGDPDAGGTLIGIAKTDQPLYPGEDEDVRLSWPSAPAGGALVHAWVLPQRARPLVHSSNVIPELKQRGPYVYLNGTYPHYGWMVNGVYAMDGNPASFWYDLDHFSAGYAPHHFFEVHFTVPVDIESITLRNPFHPAYGWKTATLTMHTDFGNDPAYEAVVTLDATVANVDVPDTKGVRRIRIEGDDVYGAAVVVGEVEVAGSFEEPLPRLHEGRSDNNRASAFLRFACDGPQPNHPPEITSTPKVTASASEPYSYQVTAADPENGAVTFALLRGPSGMAIGATSGILSWTPGYEDLGPHAVEIEARDVEGFASAQRFDLAVEARINRPPMITSDAPASASGLAWSYPVKAVDPDGDPLTWFLAAGPAGMAMDASTGLLSWAPAPGAAASVSIAVEDGRGGSARQSFTLASGDAEGDAPIPPVDADGDGFPTGADCDEGDANVSPGRVEVPGNGKDDDCNPATPDSIESGRLSAVLRPERLSYAVGQTVILFAQVRNESASEAFGPLWGDLTVEDGLGGLLHRTSESMGTFLPGMIAEHVFRVETAGWAAGTARGALTLRYGEGSLPGAETRFDLRNLDVPFEGTLDGPREVSPGGSFALAVHVKNRSPVDIAGVVLEVKLVSASTRTVLDVWSSSPLDIPRSGEASETAVFSTAAGASGGLLAGLVATLNGKTHALATARVDILARFRRGDAIEDGALDITDPIAALGYLFLGAEAPACLDALDADDSGAVDVTDPIYALSYLFLGGPRLAEPGAERCGIDPTADDLGDCRYPGTACGP